jgi:hypothetical protein
MHSGPSEAIKSYMLLIHEIDEKDDINDVSGVNDENDNNGENDINGKKTKTK